jgi:hypothetical protein
MTRIVSAMFDILTEPQMGAVEGRERGAPAL